MSRARPIRPFHVAAIAVIGVALLAVFQIESLAAQVLPNPLNLQISTYGPGSDVLLAWDSVTAPEATKVRMTIFEGWSYPVVPPGAASTIIGKTATSQRMTQNFVIPWTADPNSSSPYVTFSPESGEKYTVRVQGMNGSSALPTTSSYVRFHSPVDGNTVTPTSTPGPTATPAGILAPEELVLPAASLVRFEVESNATTTDASHLARLYGDCRTVFACLTNPSTETSVSLPTGVYTIEMEHVPMTYSEQLGEGAFLSVRYTTPPTDGFSLQVTGATLAIEDETDAYPEVGSTTPTPIPAATKRKERPGRIVTLLARTSVEALKGQTRRWRSTYVLDYTAPTSAPDERFTLFSVEARVQCADCRASVPSLTPTPIPAVRPQVGNAHVTRLDGGTLADTRIRGAETDGINWPGVAVLRSVAGPSQIPVPVILTFVSCGTLLIVLAVLMRLTRSLLIAVIGAGILFSAFATPTIGLASIGIVVIFGLVALVTLLLVHPTAT